MDCKPSTETGEGAFRIRGESGPILSGGHHKAERIGRNAYEIPYLSGVCRSFDAENFKSGIIRGRRSPPLAPPRREGPKANAFNGLRCQMNHNRTLSRATRHIVPMRPMSRLAALQPVTRRTSHCPHASQPSGPPVIHPHASRHQHRARPRPIDPGRRATISPDKAQDGQLAALHGLTTRNRAMTAQGAKNGGAGWNGRLRQWLRQWC